MHRQHSWPLSSKCIKDTNKLTNTDRDKHTYMHAHADTHPENGGGMCRFWRWAPLQSMRWKLIKDGAWSRGSFYNLYTRFNLVSRWQLTWWLREHSRGEIWWEDGAWTSRIFGLCLYINGLLEAHLLVNCWMECWWEQGTISWKSIERHCLSTGMYTRVLSKHALWR